MNNSVILKGNRYGISIVLNDKTDFSQILEDLGERLENAGEFFDYSKQLVVNFEGRVLSNNEVDQLLAVIKDKSNLNIQYVLEENSDLEATFYDIIHSEEERLSDDQKNVKEDLDESYKEVKQSVKDEMESFQTGNEKFTMFYRGNLRSGQALESKESVIIIGDVNPGASVKAGKNIIVIGSLKGNAYAGRVGDKDSFVMALNMNPIQLEIHNCVFKGQDNRFFSKSNKEAMIAKIDNNQIIMESVSKYANFDIKY